MKLVSRVVFIYLIFLVVGCKPTEETRIQNKQLQNSVQIEAEEWVENEVRNMVEGFEESGLPPIPPHQLAFLLYDPMRGLYAGSGDYSIVNEKERQIFIARAKKAQSLLREGGDPDRLIDSVCWMYYKAFAYQQTISCAEEILEAKYRFPDSSISAYQYLIRHYIEVGELVKARNLVDEAKVFTNSLGDQEIRNKKREINTFNYLGLFVDFENGNHDPFLNYHSQDLMRTNQRLLEIEQRLLELTRESASLAEKAPFESHLYRLSIQQYEDSSLFGWYLIESGRLDKAEKILEKAMFQLEEHLNYLNSEGSVEYAARPSEARDFRYGLIYDGLQLIKAKQGKYKEALEIAERGHSYIQSLSLFDTKYFMNINEIREIAKSQNLTLVKYSIIDYNFYGEDLSRGYEIDQFRYEKSLLIWVVQPDGDIHFQKIDFQDKDLVVESDIKIPKNSSRFSNFIKKTSAMIGSYNPDLGKDVEVYDPELLLNYIARANCNHSKQCLDKLSKMLIKPIEKYLPKKADSNVIFLTDGELARVPFAALKSKGKYIIEQYTISTAPSIRVFKGLSDRKKLSSSNLNSAENPLIVGNPTMPLLGESFAGRSQPPMRLSSLPNAEKEAEDIAQVWNSTYLSGDAANKENIIQRMPSASLIHFATHADSDDIILASSEPDDTEGYSSQLSAYEMDSDLRLVADLVVLSGCETGLGIVTVDGVFGLNRAFFDAGVPSVVSSLWVVEDEATSELMIEFHKQLKAGFSKAQALRQAMLETKKNYKDPYYWSGFTLVGAIE